MVSARNQALVPVAVRLTAGVADVLGHWVVLVPTEPFQYRLSLLRLIVTVTLATPPGRRVGRGAADRRSRCRRSRVPKLPEVSNAEFGNVIATVGFVVSAAMISGSESGPHPVAFSPRP